MKKETALFIIFTVGFLAYWWTAIARELPFTPARYIPFFALGLLALIFEIASLLS